MSKTLAKSSGFFQSLHLLRGIAAVLVMLLHTGFLPIGWIGVDFFFVLSGFIILYAHYQWIGKPKRLLQYFINRFTRIYPLYWLIAGLYLLIHFLLGNLADFYNGNFWAYSQSFLLLPNHPTIILISWTLSYELFFYSLFALLILSPRFIYVFYLWFGLIMGTYLGLINLSGNLSGFFFNPINLEFGLGMLAFYLLQTPSFKLSNQFAYILISFSLLGLTIGVYLEHIQRSFSIGLPCFGLVWSVVKIEKSHSFRNYAIFKYLGDASYFLYLSHTILISTGMGLVEKLSLDKYFNSLTVNLIIVFFTLIAAILGYYLIEKPMLRKCRELWGSQK